MSDRCHPHLARCCTKCASPTSHDFLPVAGHPDDDERTYRTDGTDSTYCGRPAAQHDQAGAEGEAELATLRHRLARVKHLLSAWKTTPGAYVDHGSSLGIAWQAAASDLSAALGEPASRSLHTAERDLLADPREEGGEPGMTHSADTPKTLREAREAIELILASLPASALPKPDKIEADVRGAQADPTKRIAWFGGHGYHLGTFRRGGALLPGGFYRESGAWDAIVGEAVRRLDLRQHAAPIDPTAEVPAQPWETREADQARITELENKLADRRVR